MNKQELLNLANKGAVTIDGITFEVKTHESSIGGEILNVILLPINEFSDPAYFGGGWHEYYTDEDVQELFPAMKKAAQKMEYQAQRQKIKPIEFIDLNKEDRHCNHLIKRKDNDKIYVLQKIKDSNKNYTAFQILTANKWEQGYEPCAPINCPIILEGTIYKPIWSFWLDGAIYKL